MRGEAAGAWPRVFVSDCLGFIRAFRILQGLYIGLIGEFVGILASGLNGCRDLLLIDRVDIALGPRT